MESEEIILKTSLSNVIYCNILIDGFELNPKEKKLYIATNEMNERQMELLINGIKDSVKLKTIKVGNFSPPVMQLFSNYISRNTTITSLKLEFWEDQDHIPYNLFESLRINSTIHTLSLYSRCNKELIPYIQSSPSIKSLALRKFISTSNISLVNDILSNSKITSLVISDNALEPPCLKFISQYLSLNTSLKSLNLSYNHIEEEGLQYILNCLEVNTTLTELNVSSNKMDIYSFHLTNSHICTLILSDNNFHFKGMEDLCELLRLNFITTINLASIKASDSEILLFQTLQENHSITSLNFNGNFVGPEKIRILSTCLMNNSTLLHLHLGGNDAKSEGAIILAGLLKHNGTLKSLSLEANSISIDGFDALAEVLTINTSLTFLDLRSNRTQIPFKLRDTLSINRSLRKVEISHFGSLSKLLSSQLKQLCQLNKKYFKQTEKMKLWPYNHSQLAPLERTNLENILLVIRRYYLPKDIQTYLVKSIMTSYYPFEETKKLIKTNPKVQSTHI